MPLTKSNDSLKPTYVTFGQVHVHSVNEKTFDKDCVAVLYAKDAKEGRELAFQYFGDKFFTTYFDTQWEEGNLRYFPRGLIEVEVQHEVL